MDGIIATSADGVSMTNTILISFAEKLISETDWMKQLDKDTKDASATFGAKKTVTLEFVLKNSDRWLKER